MSRSTRDQVYKPQPVKLTMMQMARITAREIKRRLIAAGQMADPALRPPKFRFAWSAAGFIGREVQANTTGEARAFIKKALGLKESDTLPPCVSIERFPNEG